MGPYVGWQPPGGPGNAQQKCCGEEGPASLWCHGSASCWEGPTFKHHCSLYQPLWSGCRRLPEGGSTPAGTTSKCNLSPKRRWQLRQCVPLKRLCVQCGQMWACACPRLGCRRLRTGRHAHVPLLWRWAACAPLQAAAPGCLATFSVTAHIGYALNAALHAGGR